MDSDGKKRLNEQWKQLQTNVERLLCERGPLISASEQFAIVAHIYRFGQCIEDCTKQPAEGQRIQDWRVPRPEPNWYLSNESYGSD